MNVAAGIEFLRSNGWLSRTPPAFQDAMLGIAVWSVVEPGISVIIAGVQGGGIWGVADGQVDITSGLSTAESPPAHIGHAGSWWGAAPVFGRPRIASMTIRSTAMLVQLPLVALNAQLDRNPAWWRHVGDLVVEHMELASVGMADLLIRNSRRRCVAVLLRIASRRLGMPASESAATVSVSHDDFAAMANLSRHTSGEILRELEADGLITLGYRSITLREPASLQAIVSD